MHMQGSAGIPVHIDCRRIVHIHLFAAKLIIIPQNHFSSCFKHFAQRFTYPHIPVIHRPQPTEHHPTISFFINVSSTDSRYITKAVKDGGDANDKTCLNICLSKSEDTEWERGKGSNRKYNCYLLRRINTFSYP